MQQKLTATTLTTEQLSQVLNISECTIQKLVKTKQLPCKYAGREPRFDLYTLLRYFQRLEGGAV